MWTYIGMVFTICVVEADDLGVRLMIVTHSTPVARFDESHSG
jgi:hypothetical protein